MADRQFHIGDILSITTGRLVSPRHMDGVYDILNYMTSVSLQTYQLPREAYACKLLLCELYPSLSPEALETQLKALDELAGYFGESREVRAQKITQWLEDVIKTVSAELPLDDSACLPVPKLKEETQKKEG